MECKSQAVCRQLTEGLAHWSSSSNLAPFDEKESRQGVCGQRGGRRWCLTD